MGRVLLSLLMMTYFSTACASESTLKLDRGVAEAGTTEVEKIEHPESLQYDSKEYKKHKEYLKFIDRHDRK